MIIFFEFSGNHFLSKEVGFQESVKTFHLRSFSVPHFNVLVMRQKHIKNPVKKLRWSQKLTVRCLTEFYTLVIRPAMSFKSPHKVQKKISSCNVRSREKSVFEPFGHTRHAVTFKLNPARTLSTCFVNQLLGFFWFFCVALRFSKCK